METEKENIITSLKEALKDPSLKRKIVKTILTEIKKDKEAKVQTVIYSGCGSYCGSRGC
jgi:hypothetical protein